MKRKVMKAVGLVMAAVMAAGTLTACGAGSDAGANADAKAKIAIVCDLAGQNDNGYNQSAVNGAKKAADELGVEYKVVEPANGVPAALEALAQDGYSVIFNLEYDFDALIKGVGGAKPIAEMYPDTLFVCFNDDPNKKEDGTAIHKNVISVMFDVHEASYIAGALSVQVLENAKVLFPEGKYQFTPPEDGGRAIGFVGGTNSNGITVFSYGFAEGINHAAQKLGVNYSFYSKYDAGFADPALGSTVAGTFYNQGVNLVYAVAGSVGDGVASKAKEMSRLAIHVDANKDAQQPGYILTCVLKNTEVPVYEIIKAYTEGKAGEMENVQNFSLSSGAASITDLAEISKSIADTEEAKQKWEAIKAYIEDLAKQIGEEKIKVTNAAAGDSFDPASCPNVTMK